MKSLLPILFALLLSLPAWADDTPILKDYHGDAVSPLCFLQNVGTEEEPVYPTQDCRDESVSKVSPFTSKNSRYTGQAYEQSFPGIDGDDEGFVERGTVSYRAIGEVEDGLIAVHLIENGGGSGVFSSLILLEPQRHNGDKTLNYEQKDVLAFGDRCNGGVKDAWMEDGRVLAYSRSVTMYDMLGLVGDPQRAILSSETAEDLPFCAACCYAEAVFDEDEFREIVFPEDRNKPYKYSSEATHCVEDLIALNIENGGNTIGKEAFGTLVREIEHTCLGRMEGE